MGAGLGLPAGTHDPSGALARNLPAPRGGLDHRGRGLGAGGGGRTSAVARGGCEDILTVATRGKRARSPSPIVTGGVGAGPGGAIWPAGSPDPSGPLARPPPALRRGLDRGGRGLGKGGGGLTAAAARGGCEDKRPAAQTTTVCGGRGRGVATLGGTSVGMSTPPAARGGDGSGGRGGGAREPGPPRAAAARGVHARRGRVQGSGGERPNSALPRTGRVGAGAGDMVLPAGSHCPPGTPARSPPAAGGVLGGVGRRLGAGGGGRTSAAARGGCEDSPTLGTPGPPSGGRGARSRDPSLVRPTDPAPLGGGPGLTRPPAGGGLSPASRKRARENGGGQPCPPPPPGACLASLPTDGGPLKRPRLESAQARHTRPYDYG